MGLPGSGKTTLSKELAYHFLIPHHNADTYREYNDDWDFSEIGRARQARRMSQQWGILDFICPTETLRRITNPDYIIWMNTGISTNYEDTKKLFEEPKKCHLEIRNLIGLSQLRKCLEDFSPGTEGIQSFLNGPIQKLVK